MIFAFGASLPKRLRKRAAEIDPVEREDHIRGFRAPRSLPAAWRSTPGRRRAADDRSGNRSAILRSLITLALSASASATRAFQRLDAARDAAHEDDGMLCALEHAPPLRRSDRRKPSDRPAA